MEANDYRLERWLAILLSLLFFLPFVARADEVLHPDFYVGDVPYKDGDMYLAIGPNALVPVRIRVERHESPEDVHHGTSVEVEGFEDSWLVRGKNLRPGPIVRAVPDTLQLVAAGKKATTTLGATTYDLSYRCTSGRCTLVLSSGGVAQELATVPANDAVVDEAEHRVVFAGDLDGDGRLDLIANHPPESWDWYPTLWLSSAATKGQLVGRAADLVGTVGGC